MRPLHIASVGLTCPLGLNAVTACAAIRAGVKRFQESRYRDDAGDPIVCSELAPLPTDMLHRERLLTLLSLAIVDAAQGIQHDELTRMPLLVGTCETGRPGRVSEVFPEVLERLQNEHGLRLAPAHSRSIPTGNTAGVRALAEARMLLERQPQLPGCFVASADSLVNAPTLRWLNQQERLKRPGHSDGVIPGEAAACVLVTRRLRPGSSRLATVLGLGFAREAATLQSEEPLRGQGLVLASRTALAEAGLDISAIDFRLSDASGEGYSFKETSLALSRMLRVRKETVPLLLPAESLGEIGTASGITSLAIASVAMARGYAPGKRALAYTSSSDGDRAVAVLEAHPSR